MDSDDGFVDDYAKVFAYHLSGIFTRKRMNEAPFSGFDFLELLAPGSGLRLFDAHPDTRFFIKDAQGVYRYASRIMLLAHGFAEPEEVLGRTDHDFIPAYLADHYTRDDRRVLLGEEIWGRVEMVMRHPAWPDWYVTSKIPLRNHEGQVIGLAGVSRDLQQAASVASPFVRFNPVLEHIRDHFASPIAVEDLARLTGMSVRGFQRHFKKAFQFTPTAYIRQFRIGKACQLLVETEETITTIAMESGFSDHSHLIREFVRAMDATPGAYRKRYRSG
ncbi:MAG: helix-turn-helix domain-containing protein [Verrucomicrobiota bacterium]